MTAGGVKLFWVAILFLVLYTVAEAVTNFWLSHWTTVHKEGTNTSVDDGLSYYLGIYGALGVLQSESNIYLFTNYRYLHDSPLSIMVLIDYAM